MSNGNTIFKKISIESFGGINPDSPLTIVFSEGYNGITMISGDEATNKTSALNAIESLLGGVFSNYAVNKKSGNISAGLEFEDNGQKYRVRLTKTQFKLEMFTNVAGKDTWIETGKDKGLIRLLLPYATSPDILMAYDGGEQIKWLKTVAGDSSDDTTLAEEHKVIYKKRTDQNNSVKIFRQQLLDTKNYVADGKSISPTEQYEADRKEVVTTDLDATETLLLTSLGKLKNSESELNKAIAGLAQFDYQISEKEKQIIELQKQIESLKERQEVGKKYVEENKNIPEQIKQVDSELQNVREIKALKENILTTTRLYDSYNKATDESTLLTSKIDDINRQREELAKSFTPPIENFEVKLGNLDDKEKGLYLKGINIAALSESERFALCLKIWKHFGTKVILIENVSSLGSNAIEIIKTFIEAGGTVFGTKMRRGQETISVSFSLNE